jgi:hypothetical protein
VVGGTVVVGTSVVVVDFSVLLTVVTGFSVSFTVVPGCSDAFAETDFVTADDVNFVEYSIVLNLDVGDAIFSSLTFEISLSKKSRIDEVGLIAVGWLFGKIFTVLIKSIFGVVDAAEFFV